MHAQTDSILEESQFKKLEALSRQFGGYKDFSNLGRTNAMRWDVIPNDRRVKRKNKK